MCKNSRYKKNFELDALINFISSNLNENQKIITINCSFQHTSGSIHVDELLCPMPYKPYDVFDGYKMNYKIWIYRIKDIYLSDDLNIDYIPSLDSNTSNELKEYITTNKDLNELYKQYQSKYSEYLNKMNELQENKDLTILKKLKLKQGLVKKKERKFLPLKKSWECNRAKYFF